MFVHAYEHEPPSVGKHWRNHGLEISPLRHASPCSHDLVRTPDENDPTSTPLPTSKNLCYDPSRVNVSEPQVKAVSAPSPKKSSTPATVMIDARYLNGQTSGIGRYTERLIENLLDIDDALRLELITSPANPAPIKHARVGYQTTGSAPNSLRTRFLIPKIINFDGVDLFHSPFNILPANLPVPALFTLHDIMWLLDANFCTDTLWRKAVTGTFYKTFIPRSAREAKRILTVSDHSREAIEDYFPDKKGKVFATYNGLDPFFHPVPDDEGWDLIERHLPRGKKFVLAVGQGSPYKNHEGAIEGFINAFPETDDDIYFVLIRRFTRSTDKRLQALMNDPRVKDRIVHLSYVSGEELRAFYGMARVFLFPSLYEGFGLPALEAMACGTPVITSKEGAPAEIGGAGALKVDPRSPEQIGDALRTLCLDDNAHTRYQNAGLKRATAFTWRRCAEQTLNVYRDLLNIHAQD